MKVSSGTSNVFLETHLFCRLGWYKDVSQSITPKMKMESIFRSKVTFLKKQKYCEHGAAVCGKQELNLTEQNAEFKEFLYVCGRTIIAGLRLGQILEL